jgi:branched-chain amino acid transport system ATP-binding protein
MHERPFVLAIEGLNAWYGPAQALFDVSLTVSRGELVVLQGLNGAGKSTLLQALIGIGPRVEGQIVWVGQTLQDWPAHRRARAGLGFVAEDRAVWRTSFARCWVCFQACKTCWSARPAR